MRSDEDAEPADVVDCSTTYRAIEHQALAFEIGLHGQQLSAPQLDVNRERG